MLGVLDDTKHRSTHRRRFGCVAKPAVWPIPKLDGGVPVARPIGAPVTTGVSFAYEQPNTDACSVPRRLPVFAAHDGAIAYAGHLSDGCAVIVDHLDGWATHYANLRSAFATPTNGQPGLGQRVRAGDALGYVGSRGDDALGGLRFELWRRNGGSRYLRVDPRPYMKHWLVIPWVDGLTTPANGNEA